jgi:hypothetical protein
MFAAISIKFTMGELFKYAAACPWLSLAEIAILEQHYTAISARVENGAALHYEDEGQASQEKNKDNPPKRMRLEPTPKRMSLRPEDHQENPDNGLATHPENHQDTLTQLSESELEALIE